MLQEHKAMSKTMSRKVTVLLFITTCFAVGFVAAQLAEGEQPRKKKGGDYELPTMPEGVKLFTREGDFDSDGSPEILVENRLLRLVIEPALGGRVGSWVYKPTGHDFTRRPNTSGEGGFLIDSSERQVTDWLETRFEYLVQKSEERVKVFMHQRGKGKPRTHLILYKTLTLRSDSAAVSVDYRIKNVYIGMTKQTVSLYFRNYLAARSGPLYLFWPRKTGIEKKDIAGLVGGQTVTDSARGWAAVLDEKSGTGLGVSVDYDYVNAFRAESQGKTLTELVWEYSPVGLEPAKSLQASATFLAFSGLKSVGGCGSEAVGSIKVEEGASVGSPADVGKPIALTAQVAAARGGKAQLVLTVRRLPDVR